MGPIVALIRVALPKLMQSSDALLCHELLARMPKLVVVGYEWRHILIRIPIAGLPLAPVSVWKLLLHILPLGL